MSDVSPPPPKPIGPIGEIRIFAGVRPPRGWLICDGRSLALDQYPDLGAVLRTTFGGDAQSFNLPDFRGRLPVATNATNATGKIVPPVLGAIGGVESVTLSADQIPAHTHALSASTSTASSNAAAADAALAGMAADVKGYYVPDRAARRKSVTLAGDVIDPGPVANAHSNLMPALALNFIIAATADAWTWMTEQSFQDGYDVFIGEVRAFAFGYAPAGWAVCDGSPISIDAAFELYLLIADMYGARHGTMMFPPDLGGRALMGAGAGVGLTRRQLAEISGTPDVSLTPDQTPPHTHALAAASASSSGKTALTPSENDWLGSEALNAELFSDATTPSTGMSGVLTTSGSGAPHENRQPYMAVNYCIAFAGLFPLPGDLSD